MPVKIGRKHSTSLNTSSSTRQRLRYAERWDLSQLVENPVQRFETLAEEIESKVAQFEAARAYLSPTMEISAFHPLLTLSEDIAAASSRISAYAYLWFSENTKNLAARSLRRRSRSGSSRFRTEWYFSISGGRASMRATHAGS